MVAGKKSKKNVPEEVRDEETETEKDGEKEGGGEVEDEVGESELNSSNEITTTAEVHHRLDTDTD